MNLASRGGHNLAAFLHSPLEGIPCHRVKRRCLAAINIQGWRREEGRGIYLVSREEEGREGGAELKSGTHPALPSSQSNPRATFSV